MQWMQMAQACSSARMHATAHALCSEEAEWKACINITWGQQLTER